jgi:diaminohydroxyphosphoribosylaminopyrimidine deaminase/5-amino-6-(5-phosphoribosylamino)uracil reductase
VAGAFHRSGLVDHYVLYLAPALFGGDDAFGLFSGAGAVTMSDVWRGRITRVTPLGDDIRVDLIPVRSS